ncbi:hypothetical protein KC951_02700 [Candidatus Saccharibacteria bacterium]|nr:hypothetical protein [Candidatus Saccharibacteria bacterium]
MTSATKDTIYIDVDDEITAIIDKMDSSDAKIVALVLPKRAAALQSIVNMKLLKRAGDEAGKNVVLITSEAGLLPLAGACGMYVAKNLQSKPIVPDAPVVPEADHEETADVEGDDTPLDTDKTVGELAGDKQVDDTVELDDAPAKASAASKSAKSKGKKGKKDKKPKIPNFEKFRLKLFLAIGGVIVLLLAFYAAVFVAPRATIVIKTDTSTATTDVQFTTSPSKVSFDEATMTVPSENATKKVEESQTAPATGQKDVGTKATGSLTIKNCSSEPVTIPSGTAVSSNNLTFITNTSISLDSGNFTPPPGSTCKDTGSHVGTVGVTAQNNGDQYNLASGSTYSVAGFGSSVTGVGSAMTGGSSKIAKVVSQQDIDAATKKLNVNDDTIKSELQKELESQGYYALTGTFAKKDESTTVTPGLDQEATEVKVSYTATYTMVGVNEDDLEKLIDLSVTDELDDGKLEVQDYGLQQATVTVKSTNPNGDMVINLETTVTIGPNIDEDKLKADIAGKKRGQTENIVKVLPGVKDVEVDYSPFWVSRTPKQPAKITIKFEKAN